MCSILLGLIIDLPLAGGMDSSRLVRAVRALLDFLFLAQHQSHTSETIHRLQGSLDVFHANKAIFVDLGVRKHFNIPKLHSLMHYISSIKLFGTTDNYNTEQSERLHIDLTKDAYRATNHKNEYPQMTVWLERCEKLQQHGAFIEWTQRRDHPGQQSRTPMGPLHVRAQTLKMAVNPTFKAVPICDVIRKYGAVDFVDALADFIARINYPLASAQELARRSEDTLIPFSRVPIYHNMKFTMSGSGEVTDAVHARAEQTDLCGRIVPSRFDTVLVQGRAPHGQRNKGKSVCLF